MGGKASPRVVTALLPSALGGFAGLAFGLCVAFAGPDERRLAGVGLAILFALGAFVLGVLGQEIQRRVVVAGFRLLGHRGRSTGSAQNPSPEDG